MLNGVDEDQLMLSMTLRSPTAERQRLNISIAAHFTSCLNARGALTKGWSLLRFRYPPSSWTTSGIRRPSLMYSVDRLRSWTPADPLLYSFATHPKGQDHRRSEHSSPWDVVIIRRASMIYVWCEAHHERHRQVLWRASNVRDRLD